MTERERGIPTMKIGLQLYTLREDSGKDFVSVLEYVAKCGYDSVEFAGFYGMSPAEVRSQLDRLGLVCSSTHTGAEGVFDAPEETIAAHQALGCSYVVLPFHPMKTAAEARALAERFRKVQPFYAANGMTLCYHNHGHEFQQDGGKYLLEILAEEAPDLMLEVDTYWSTVGGADTCAFLRKYRDRIALIHLKDGNKDGLQAIGDGNIDIQAILDTVKELGLNQVIVENDDPKPDGFTNVKRCIDNLKQDFIL